MTRVNGKKSGTKKKVCLDLGRLTAITSVNLGFAQAHSRNQGPGLQTRRDSTKKRTVKKGNSKKKKKKKKCEK